MGVFIISILSLISYGGFIASLTLASLMTERQETASFRRPSFLTIDYCTIFHEIVCGLCTNKQPFIRLVGP